MNKRRLIFCIFLFFFSLFIIYSDSDFFLMGEIQTSPWFYEPLYDMDCISFATTWTPGIKFGWFSLGLSMYGNYVSVNGNNDSSLFKGAWISAGCNIMTTYTFTSRFELALGAGGLWNQSSFDYNDSGWLTRPLPGIEITVSTMFSLTRFIRLELVGILDKVLSENDLLDDLNCTLGARAYIHPKVEWVSLYAEGDAFYWSYSSEIIPEGIKSWMFQARLGISLDINKKRSGTTIIKTGVNEDDNKINPLDNTDESPDNLSDQNETEQDNEKNKYADPFLSSLYRSKTGDTIQFYTILFDDDKINNGSFQVLDGIAEILNDNSSMIISISGYAELMLDPLKELELCKVRAGKIKEYLLDKGVNDSQVRQNPVGNIITDKKTYISIKVIKNDSLTL